MLLQIEGTGVCNAACTFCVYPTEHNARPKGRMAWELFERIIDEAATIPQFTEVCITGLSESLLDPDLEKRIRLVRWRMPGAFIYVYTNGTYLTPKRYESLQDAGLSMILVSLNAADAETRRRVMGLDDWDKVISNITEAIAREKTCHVRIRAVINQDSFTLEDAQPLFRLWGAQAEGGRVLAINEGNWAGDSRSVRSWKPNEACGRALGMMYVTFDGKLTPCCFDPVGKLTFGDLNKDSIREIYNSDKYVAFREDHANDQADKHEICKNCTRI